ncbi:MAG: AsmA-like C-terminal region-containing protein, partial [Gemmatimonadota bacterium]|nr:AsmA-like C-terminal region-containing protein [Gemmatimonadota bacterium]
MPQTEPAPTPRRRRLLLWLAAAVAVLVVLGVGTAVLARTVLDPAALADRIEPRLAEALNRPVEVRGARVRLWPRPALELTGLRVENVGRFAGSPLATVDAVRLRPRLLPLLRREVVVDRIGIHSPRLLVVAAEDGTTNLRDFGARTRDGSGEGDDGPAADADDGAFAIALRSVVLEDGRFGYVDRARGRSVRADGLEARARLGRAGDGAWDTEGHATADSFGAVFPDLLPGSPGAADVRFEWDGHAPAGFASLEIRRGALLAGPVRAAVAGRIDSLASPARRIDLSLAAEGLPLADLARAGGRDSDLRAGGTLDLTLRVLGTVGPDARPDVSGRAILKGAELAVGSAPPLLSGVDADIRLADGSAAVQAAGRLADGEAAAEGTIRVDSLLPLDLRVRAEFGLAALVAALPAPARGAPPRPDARGRVELDARLTGPGADPTALRANGTATLADVAVPLRSLTVPVRVPAATLRLAGREASWRDLRIELGPSAAWSSGALRLPAGSAGSGDAGPRRPVVEMDVRSRRLDLAAIRPPPPESEAGWGRLAFASLGDRRIGSRTPREVAAGRDMRRPGAPPVRGTVALQLDTLLTATDTLTEVTGTLRLQEDRIEVEDLRFAAWGGRGEAAGSLAVDEGAVQPFGLRLSLSGVRAERWLGRHTPLGQVVQGALRLELELAGGLDTLLLPAEASLAGVGTAEIREGRIGPNPLLEGLRSFLALPEGTGTRIRDWVSPFRIEHDRLVLSDARLRLQGFEADLAGAVGFGGELDLGVLLRPDEVVGRGLAAGGGGAALPAGLREALGGGVPVELGLRIGGRLGAPSLSLDPAASTAGIERRAQEAVRRGLEGALERALEGAAGGAARAPGDTTA